MTISDLDPGHVELLARSAVPVGVAVAAGVRSVRTVDDLPVGLRWAPTPGVLFPWHRLDGSTVPQYRPDAPAGSNGNRPKYVFPTGAGSPISVVPAMRARLESGDYSTVVVVEGTRQCLAAVAHAPAEVLVVGIGGCWGWSTDGVPDIDLGRLGVAGRRVVVAFDADVGSNRAVYDAAHRLGEHLAVLGATAVTHLRLPAGGTAGLDDYLAAQDDPGGVLSALLGRAGPLGRAPAKPKRDASPPPAAAAADDDDFGDVADEPGHWVLDDLRGWLTSYVAYPSAAYADAVVLWAAHTHLLDQCASTPRLALLSPEPGSGKTRTLELLELVARRGRHVMSMSPAVLYRLVDAERPTLLVDEVDALFGPRAAKDHDDLRALVNAGHRPGAVVMRMVGEGAAMVPGEFKAYCPVALAGLGDLPDTIRQRSVIVPMRRRAPDEPVRPYRERTTRPEGAALHRRLAAWAQRHADDVPEEPELPAGVTDRPADVWEPLVAVADAAGGDWPARARAACEAIVTAASETGDASIGVRLLGDIRTVIGDRDRITSAALVEGLVAIEEAPWGDWRGKPVDARWLARRLRPYGVRPHNVRGPEDTVKKGYEAADFHDAFARYLSPPKKTGETATTATGATSQVRHVADDSPVADLTATGFGTATPLSRDVADVADVADSDPLVSGESPGTEREELAWDL